MQETFGSLVNQTNSTATLYWIPVKKYSDLNYRVAPCFHVTKDFFHTLVYMVFLSFLL